MGLDAVELVMEVEDHFGVTIGYSEAPEAIHTVGDLMSFLQGRIQMGRESRCLALPFFFKLRRIVREVTGEECVRIRPGDSVVQRLSARQRRMLWKRLPTLLDCPPDDLRYPFWMKWILLALTTALFVAALVLGLWIDPLILPLTFAVALAITLALLWLTVPLRTIPPDDWKTFGEITLHLVGTAAATKQLHLRTADEILAGLRPIIVNILGIDPNEVVPSARFVEDLGMS